MRGRFPCPGNPSVRPDRVLMVPACRPVGCAAVNIRSASDAVPATTGRAGRRPAPVVLVLMENHSYGQIAGSASAPYLNRFAHRGTLFTDMNAVSHPSLPNYLALRRGQRWAVRADKCPTRSFHAKNIFEQLSAHRRSWRSWEESMPGRCVRSNARARTPCGTTRPCMAHRPVSACVPKFDVPYPKSLPAMPRPDLHHTEHLPRHARLLRGGRRAWLNASKLLKRGAIVVITYDEGEGNNYVFCAARPGCRSGRAAASGVYALRAARGIERHFGLRRLRQGATARAVPLTSDRAGRRGVASRGEPDHRDDRPWVSAALRDRRRSPRWAWVRPRGPSASPRPPGGSRAGRCRRVIGSRDRGAALPRDRGGGTRCCGSAVCARLARAGGRVMPGLLRVRVLPAVRLVAAPRRAARWTADERATRTATPARSRRRLSTRSANAPTIPAASRSRRQK